MNQTLTKITLVIFVLLMVGTGYAQATILQGQTSSNGDYWIIVEKNPVTNQSAYPQPFTTLHSNSLQIDIYTPISHNDTLKVVIEQYTQVNGNKTNPQWENQTISTPYRSFSRDQITLPPANSQETLQITIANTTITYYHLSIPSANIPFYSQGKLQFLGFVMAVTALIIFMTAGLARLLIKKAKYFPPLPVRLWAGAAIMSGLIAYSIASTNYYTIPTVEWGEWFIPITIISLLVFLHLYPSESKKELYIQLTGDYKNLEAKTGIYSIMTAPANDYTGWKDELGKQSGKQYIRSRSYIDFLKRLIGKQIRIAWEQGQDPITMPQPTTKVPKWKLKDTEKEDHPYSEGYLLDPDATPTIKKHILDETKRIKQKIKVLHIEISGKHMQHVEEFLTDYRAAVAAGEQIEVLDLKNTELQAQLKSGIYRHQDETIQRFTEMLRINQPETPQEPIKQDPIRTVQNEAEQQKKQLEGKQ